MLHIISSIQKSQNPSDLDANNILLNKPRGNDSDCASYGELYDVICYLLQILIC